MATRYDLGMDNGFYRGDDIPFTFTFTDEVPNPVDLTGKTVYFTIKLTPTTADADADYRGEFTTGGADGIATFTMTQAESAALLPTIYEYDLQILDGGSLTTHLYGKIKFIGGDLDNV